MKSVSTPQDFNMSKKRRPQQGQIPDQVHPFMANELIGPTKTLPVQKPVLGKNDRVLETGSQGQTRLTCGRL